MHENYTIIYFWNKKQLKIITDKWICSDLISKLFCNENFYVVNILWSLIINYEYIQNEMNKPIIENEKW